MADPELRARILRLLRGDFQPDDLTHIFLYARYCCNGSEPVKDVGDFVAHKHLRNQGPVTRSTKDWLITAKYYFQIMQKAVDLKNLPPDFGDFLRAALYRSGNQTIKRQTGGMTLSHAKRVLPQLLDRMKNVDGSFSLKRHTKDELALFTFLVNYLPEHAPAFTNNRLFSDLVLILKRDGLLLAGEAKRFEELKTAIGIYVVSTMHNSLADMGNGSKIALTADPRALPAGLGIVAPVPVLLHMVPQDAPEHWIDSATTRIPGRPERAMMLTRTMFSTEIDPATHCTQELLSLPKWAGVPIEITPDLRLGVLR